MWLKYKINDFKYPIGFKVNIKTNKVVLGGPNKIIDLMFEILTEYFNQKNLKPIATSPDKSKFVFEMKYQIVFGIIHKMKKYLIVEKISKMERIYR